MKRTVVTLLTLQIALGALHAQTAPPSPGMPDPHAKLVETVDIRVINLDVVVNDRKGKRVHGLSASDFEVFENGVPQKISNFYEVGAELAKQPDGTVAKLPASAPSLEPVEQTPIATQRRVIFYIDNLSLAPFNRNRVFTAMKKFVVDVMRPGDQAMIATWNRSLKVRVPFTSDTAQIIQNLDAIAGESSFGLHNLSDRRDRESQIREARSYNDAVVVARQYAQSVEHDLRQSAEAINGLMQTLAGVDGKKMLVLTSEGFPIQPGREMFSYVDDTKKDHKDWQDSGSALLEAMSFDSSALIRSIGNSANANGITLYTLHAGGLNADSENSAENGRATSYIVQQAALTNSTESLFLLADMTGGRATVGTNNFKDAFEQIRSDAESFYSIGYRATTERVDRQRSVEVRPRNRALNVRSRKSYVEKSVPTEMRDRVIAGVFYPQKTNELKIAAITGTPVQTDVDRFRVPIEVRIPMESLTFLPQGEVYVGGFSVYLVVANKDGDMSDVQQQSQRIPLSKKEFETGIKGKYYTYTVDLVMEKGRNKISLGVVDEISNATGFDRREILAADLR